MKFLMLMMVNVFLLVGCSLHNNDKVDLSENITIVPVEVSESDTVEAVAKNEKRSLTVKHEVKGKDVYIECYVPNFHFSQENVGKRNKDGEGHIHLYLNGEKITKIYKAAFIVKGLPSGKHKIKIEIAHNNHTPYDKLDEELEVEIP